MFRKIRLWFSDRFGAGRMLRDFTGAFPGQCPVCSFHAYGIREGHVSKPVPEHTCPENYARWAKRPAVTKLETL